MSDSAEVVLARIETKLDAVLHEAADHEDRIRRLERALWMASGIAAAAGAGLGTGLNALLKLSH